ncbi:MAG: GtrA family protein [Bosea sp.]|nr:GtrA family protein [Bosea sp. (in: a-proteobacteria)]
MKNAWRVLRFLAVGSVVNIVFYGLYLLFTLAGGSPLAAMTVTYCGAVLAGFLLNRRITFSDRNIHDGALLRYCAAYGFGFFTNLTILWLFAERLGYSHEIVQALVTFILAIMLFLMQKYWVFPGR